MPRLPKHRWLVAAAIRATQAGVIVVAAFVASRHPVAAGSLVTLVTLWFAASFWFARNGERLAEAVARMDLDGIERVARSRDLFHRYRAIVLLAVVGDVARARAHGRVTPCVCGECEPEEIDRDLGAELRALALVENGDPKRAVFALRDSLPGERSFTQGTHLSLAAYAALATGDVPKDKLDVTLSVGRYCAPMRWPLELAAAKGLAAQGDLDGAHRRLSSAPAPWRKRFEDSLAKPLTRAPRIRRVREARAR